MKLFGVEEERKIEEKLGLLPIVEKIVFPPRNKDFFPVDVYTKDGVIPFRVLSLDRAYPAIVEMRIKESRKERNDRHILIMAAYISELSAAICKKYDVGYIDYSGNCLISLENIYISDVGHDNLFPKKEKNEMTFRFTSKVSSSILRVLLRDVSIPWKLKRLSEEVGCSIGMVARVKEFLCNQVWAEMGEDGLRLIDAKGLLRAWSNAYTVPKDRVINAYTLLPVPAFERKASKCIADKGYAGCLTGFSGGARYTPVVRYNKVHMWLSEKDIWSFMKDTEIKQIDSGANVTIYVSAEDDVYIDRREVNEDMVAAPVQVYLDLMQLKGRGEEMAEAILSKEIEK